MFEKKGSVSKAEGHYVQYTLLPFKSEHIFTLNYHFILVLACIYISHKLSFCRYCSPNVVMAVASVSVGGIPLWYLMTRRIGCSSCNGMYASPCTAEPECRPSRVDWVEAGAVSRAVRNQYSCSKCLNLHYLIFFVDAGLQPRQRFSLRQHVCVLVWVARSSYVPCFCGHDVTVFARFSVN